MTAEDWKYVEERWGQIFSYYPVELLVDGYRLKLLTRKKKMSLCVDIVINGELSIPDKAYFLPDEEIELDEISRRFCRLEKKPARSRKKEEEAKAWNKTVKRLKRPDLTMELNPKITYVWPTWVSFRAFKKHLIANNLSIDLVKRKHLRIADLSPAFENGDMMF